MSNALSQNDKCNCDLHVLILRYTACECVQWKFTGFIA